MNDARATLYIFAGLPGVGKSTVARALATRVRAVYLRIDTVEQAIRDMCDLDVQGEGYRLCYRVAADNLRLGSNVVADSCNPIELTREEWRRVADEEGARAIDIEVICSDVAEHRHRVENREVDVPGLVLPTWQQVVEREYDEWHTDRIVVDTAGRTAHASALTLFDTLDIRHH